MGNNSLKSILFEICVAKQRMNHFKNIPEKSDAMTSTLKQIMNLFDELYRRSVASQEQVDDKRFLLFTEDAPDGSIVTKAEYEEGLKQMTKLDRKTHVIVPLDLRRNV